MNLLSLNTQFMNRISLFLQFDLTQWLNETHPVFSERTRLLELVHGALCACGQDPEPEFLIPFHLFTKHWTGLLHYCFPDHYSDCLRLLLTSKCGLTSHTISNIQYTACDLHLCSSSLLISF